MWSWPVIFERNLSRSARVVFNGVINNINRLKKWSAINEDVYTVKEVGKQCASIRKLYAHGYGVANCLILILGENIGNVKAFWLSLFDVESDGTDHQSRSYSLVHLHC
jgi:hypothetical protein